MDCLQWFKSRTVEPFSTVGLAFNQSDFAQYAQVLRNSRVRNPELFNTISDRSRFMGEKSQQCPAIRVRYGMKNV